MTFQLANITSMGGERQQVQPELEILELELPAISRRSRWVGERESGRASESLKWVNLSFMIPLRSELAMTLTVTALSRYMTLLYPQKFINLHPIHPASAALTLQSCDDNW